MKIKNKKTGHAPLLPQALSEALLCAIAPTLPEESRARALRAKVLALASSTQPSPAQLQTIHADEGNWKTIAPLVEMKMLYDVGSSRSFLIRLQAGGRLPPHDHPADEECIVLAGEGMIGDILLRAGDYHLAPKGARHGETYTATGALLFIRTAAADYRAGA